VTGGPGAADADLERGLRALAEVTDGRDPTEEAAEFVLALLTPGCFAAGQAEPAIRFLRSEGFEPVYTQMLSFDEERVGRVWRDSLAAMKPARRTVVHELLMSGESLLLLLRDSKRSRVLSASERLAELKGHSNPSKCPPDSLRVRLGAANRVINLIHSADSTSSTVRELAILLDDDLPAAWCAAVDRRSTPLAVQPVPLGVGIRWCGNSIAHVCVIVRARLVDALTAPAWRAGERTGNRVDGWRIRCADELRWISGQSIKDPRRVAAAYRERFPRPMVTEDRGVASSAPGRARLAALRLLDTLQQGGPVDLERLRRTLEQSRCVLDGWEWVVLASSAVMSADDG
jgi:nucleoside diphosphate kinase